MPKLWTPGRSKEKVEVDVKAVMKSPTERKKDGGSYFDDELETQAESDAKFTIQMEELVAHLRARPDHEVYVGGSEERDQLRKVFNHWKQTGVISHNPNIRIDYGVADGAIRIGDGR